jgi:uncharacterized DUF497 family protein
MGLIFKWDKKKEKQNVTKHNVSFKEASTVFKDELSLTIDDPIHSSEENRLIIIGESIEHRLLVVVHTERNDQIRIINARKATKIERRYYESK